MTLRVNIGLVRDFFVILYADDILLISASVSDLQNLLHRCELELYWLNMAINARKSCCMRIGPHCDKNCAPIITTDGSIIPWVSQIHYLGVDFVKSQCLKISLVNAKKSFYRALNAVFGKIGRTASIPVLLDLVNKKCLPILLYGLEACPLNKADNSSLDFIMNRFLMKLLNTANINIVNECARYFDVKPISLRLLTRSAKFVKQFNASDNLYCQLVTGLAA